MSEAKFRSDLPVWEVRDGCCGSDALIARSAWVQEPGARRDGEGEDAYRRVITAMLKGRHGCYDSDTEVLTREGWKRWPDVTGEEEFLTIDRHTNAMEYQRAERLVRKPVSEPMVRVKMANADLLVTQDHNMLASPLIVNRWGDFDLMPAKRMLDETVRLRMGGGEWCGEEHTDELPLQLIGFFIGDGWCPPNGTRLEFHLHKPRKVGYLADIVENANLAVEASGRDGDRYRVMVPTHLRQLFAGCYTEDGEKRIPPALLNLPADRLADLFDGLMEADGSVTASGKATYSTTSRLLADQIQELAVKIGRAAVIKDHPFCGDTGHYGTKRRYRLTIYRERNSQPRVGWTTEARARQVTLEHYEGDVHCVTVPNGTLYVRRNGIPCWCGNTPFEKGLLTVYVESPAVVWWEWTRHRFMSLDADDFSFSLESGRYKVLDGDFYVPQASRPLREPAGFKPMRPSLLPDKDVAFLYEQTARMAAVAGWERYQKAIEFGAAREVARLLLPFSVYYAGYVSANPRTWLQFFSLRTKSDAATYQTFPQWEIQEVSEQCESLFKARWPLTYAAFVETGRVAP